MDRRFALYHEGFTHEIRSMTVSERAEISRYLQERYGNPYTYGEHMIKNYNANWRLERAKRRFTGGHRIYLKHDHDLVILGLKHGLTVVRA